MGVFRVPVELKNWQNRFLPEDERGEDVECEALGYNRSPASPAPSLPVSGPQRQVGRLRRSRTVIIEALVDSGAIELSLPAEMIRKLRLEQTGEIRVYTADGSRPTYRVFGIVDLTVQGRSCQVRAIELPEATEPLLGALPLEAMDWHISSREKRLLPNPESPKEPLLPLC